LANLDPIIRHQQPIDLARKIAISSLGQDTSFAVPCATCQTTLITLSSAAWVSRTSGVKSPEDGFDTDRVPCTGGDAVSGELTEPGPA